MYRRQLNISSKGKFTFWFMAIVVHNCLGRQAVAKEIKRSSSSIVDAIYNIYIIANWLIVSSHIMMILNC